MSGVVRDVCYVCHGPKEPGQKCKPCRDANKKRNYEKQKAKPKQKKTYSERRCSGCGESHLEQTVMNKCASCRKQYDRQMYERKKELALSRTDDKIECPTCGTVRMQFTKNGVKTSCRPCHAKWVEENLEYLLAYHRADKARKRAENPEEWKQRLLDWERDNPEKVAMMQLKSRLKKYGIDVETYKNMLDFQGGVCALCKNPEVEIISKKYPYPRSLCVDHDHNTGKVRALLCQKCNQGIGAFKDDPMLLCVAAEYLQYHGTTVWA